MEKEKHKPFIRISWEEAKELMEFAVCEKYNATGKIELMKDYGFDGIGEFYEEPTFVDVYLN